MAISITWGQKIINVPKADMNLVQASPVEIRELDLNQFRAALNDLQDSEEGMAHDTTHVHNPPLAVGGVELARTIEIINDYTVTFEDGQYAVNLVGANSNVGDRVNVNQVSVRSANSAGLVTSAAIEYGEYGGGVTIDLQNTTGKSTNGSVYPTGTLRQPSSNIDDALVICASKGFSKIYILGNATFDTGHDIDRFTIIGTSHVQNVVTLEAGASVTNTVFREVEVVGVLDGNNQLNDCVITDLTYFSGHIHNCGLKGTITLAGTTPSVISGCMTIDPLNPPTINMGGSGQDLAMPHYSGLVTISNLTGSGNIAGIGLMGGQVVIDSANVTNGTIWVSGSGELLDESGNYIPTGMWNTNVTIFCTSVSAEYNANRVWESIKAGYTGAGTFGNDLAVTSDIPTVAEIADGVLDEPSGDHEDVGSFGELVSIIESKTSTIDWSMITMLWDAAGGRRKIDTVTNQEIFYKADNTTEVMRFNLFDNLGAPTTTNVFERVRV